MPTRLLSRTRSVVTAALPVALLLASSALAGCSGSAPAAETPDAGGATSTTGTDTGDTSSSDPGTSDPGTTPSDPGAGTGTTTDDAGASQGGGSDGGAGSGDGGGAGTGHGDGGGGHHDAGTTTPGGDAGLACPAGAQSETEPNGTPATANVVHAGVVCGAVGQAGDDDDYVTFTFGAKQSYTWNIPNGSRVSVNESRTGNTVTLRVRPRAGERNAYTINIGIQ